MRVGQLNNRNDQPALCALFACEAGLSEPEIGLKHAFVPLISVVRSFDFGKRSTTNG